MPELKPLFNNQPVGNSITVDLDIFFDDFVRELEEIPEKDRPGFTRHAVITRIMMIENAIQQEIQRSLYRRSSNGHVHLRLYLCQEVSVLDAFLIRATLWDDRTRLALDEARYLLTGSLHEMNRCFDEKADGEGVKRAGPWISLHSGKDRLHEEARKDFESFDWKLAHEKAEHHNLVLGHGEQWNIGKKVDPDQTELPAEETSDLGFC
jgi:hypothetical protein